MRRGLYFLREPLTQFALALILWLAIDGLAETIGKRITFVPRWLALPVALVLVLGLGTLIVIVVVEQYRRHARRSTRRVIEITAQPGGWRNCTRPLGLAGPAPTVGDLIARIDPARLAAEIGAGPAERSRPTRCSS